MDYTIVTAETKQGEKLSLRRYSDAAKFAGLSSTNRAKSYRYTLEDGTPLTHYNAHLVAPGNVVITRPDER